MRSRNDIERDMLEWGGVASSVHVDEATRENAKGKIPALQEEWMNAPEELGANYSTDYHIAILTRKVDALSKQLSELQLNK